MTQLLTHRSGGAWAAIETGSLPRLWRALIVLLLVCGAACRVVQYAARASFMNDEACVVLNVMDHSAWRLLGPLDYDQVCPPGFLWIERGIGRAFGYGEYAMRSFPLLASLAALGLFGWLIWRLFPPPVAVCGLAWFALCPTLTDYAAQVKQYGSDTLIVLALFCIAVGLPGVSAMRRTIAASTLAAAAVWFSHPVVFVFAGIWLVLAWQCRREGRRASFFAIAGGLLFAASFIALYLVSIRHERDPYVYVFWARGFPPLKDPAKLPEWLFGQLFELCRQPWRPMGVPMAILTACGTGWLILRRHGEWAIAFLGPVVLTILAAGAGVYPFSPGRLTLFLLPGLFLTAAAGAQWFRSGGAGFLRRVWWLLPVIIIGWGAVESGRLLVHPLFHSHLRPVVQYVRAHRRAGDAIYITGEATTWINSEGNDGRRHVEFFCYWRHPAGVVSRSLPAADQIPPGRFWITFPFNPRKGPGFMDAKLEGIRAVAIQRDVFLVKQGGACYLFERILKRQD